MKNTENNNVIGNGQRVRIFPAATKVLSTLLVLCHLTGPAIGSVHAESSNQVGSSTSVTRENNENIQLSTLPSKEDAKKGEFFHTNVLIDVGCGFIDCVGYIAKNDDTLSSISKRMCKYYGIEPTTKYWPDLPALNRKKNTIVNGGDVFYIPMYLDDLEYFHNLIKESGWTASFIRANDVYGNQQAQMNNEQQKEKVSAEYVYSMLNQLYNQGGYVEELTGEYTNNIDSEFVNNYFKLLGLDKNYEISYDPSVGVPQEFRWASKEIILTVDEILNGEYNSEIRQGNSK